jgi:hypothetical protein
MPLHHEAIMRADQTRFPTRNAENEMKTGKLQPETPRLVQPERGMLVGFNSPVPRRD